MDGIVFELIEANIKEAVNQIRPDVRYVPKYGGQVLVLDPNDDKKFVGGIFTYKDHVSLEFSEGAGFDDPNGHLEGKGKNRRHLKFRALEDVDTKDTKMFLKQALKS